MKRVFSKLVSAALATTMVLSCIPATSTQTNGLQFFAPKVVQAASQIGITESKGWMESAWVAWRPSSTSGVSYYKVSYSKNGSGYTQIDDELVRQYKDGHWRADIVGIAAGSYTIKVEACNSSGSAVATETASVTVTSHDRTGFTFSPESDCYSSSDPLQCGGYKGDGTPKAGAEILYITSASDIDSVTDSTGTKGLSTILQGRNKRTSTPLIVRIVGKIQYSGSELNSSGYIQIKPSTAYTNYNTTIEGIGTDATLNFGFLLRNASNVEIRNLAIHDFADDGISLDTDNSNVWLHNNEFFYGVQGSGDKAKGDGSSDVKNDSKYVTLSYNHYWDAGKCSLCGMKSETGDNLISYHHNWFDHSDSRHPRIRTMFVHVYNNYYDGVAKYGVGASQDSNAFVEGNYFRNTKYPVLQGSVGHDNGTFDDSPAIGAIKLWNNVMEGSQTQFTAGSSGETSSNADGCVATSRNQKITYKTAAGATYRNTDVSNSYIQSIASKIQEPAAAKTTVEKYAGRVGGGDFKAATGFAFTSADDTDYEINTTLRTAITNYYKNSVSSQYAISKVGGSVDGTFVPVETQSTTEATTEATTKAPSGGDNPVESTTSAPVSGSLTALAAGTYDYNTILSDTSKFAVSGSSSDTQIKINENGYVQFAVNSNANVTINYKCGSTTTSKTAAVTLNGKTSTYLNGGADAADFTVSGLSAGTYKITGKQTEGTTAQIISITVAYGSGGGSTTPTVIKGDADSDGGVDKDDVTTIITYLAKGVGSVSNNADVTGDGAVTVADAYRISQKVLGIISSF